MEGGINVGQVIEMVRRHARPWKTPSAFSPHKAEADIKQAGLEITGPVALRYKSVTQPNASAAYVKRIQRMATLPEFYRLNYIRQLANTHIAVNLEGAHNRLSHCLGTLDVAACFIDRVQDALPIAAKLGPAEIKAVLVYAFVHDCYHGPMGHTLDLIRDLLWGPSAGERIDKHLLRNAIGSRTGFLWKAVLGHVADNEDECEKIFDLIDKFVSPGEKLGQKAFLAEIVDSDLDSDRIDYIWRDHTHLEMTGFERTSDIRALIDSVLPIDEKIEGSIQRNVSFGDAVEADDKIETHLYFGREYAAEIVRVLLEKRVEFYRKYYEHPMKLIADEMLVHAIYYALREAGVVTTSGAAPGFGDEFSFLTDEGLVGFLSELTSRPGFEIPMALLRDFRANNGFQMVYKKSLPRRKLAELKLRDERTRHGLQSLISERWPEIQRAAAATPIGLVGNREYEQLIRDFDARIRERIFVDEKDNLVPAARASVGARELKYTVENDIFRLQVIYGGGFMKRAKLEMLLWRDLQTDPEFSNALVRLADTIASTTSAKTASVLESLQITPLVFITPSWIPSVDAADLAAHKRGYRPGGIRFHQDKKPSPVQIKLRIGEEEDDYPLIVSAPPALCERGMTEIIGGAFEKLLTTRKWLLAEML